MIKISNVKWPNPFAKYKLFSCSVSKTHLKGIIAYQVFRWENVFWVTAGFSISFNASCNAPPASWLTDLLLSFTHLHFLSISSSNSSLLKPALALACINFKIMLWNISANVLKENQILLLNNSAKITHFRVIISYFPNDLRIKVLSFMLAQPLGSCRRFPLKLGHSPYLNI